jgi:hypothetical protein
MFSNFWWRCTLDTDLQRGDLLANMINPFAAIFDEKGNPVEVLNYFVVRQWFLDRDTFFGRIRRDRNDTNERR